MGRRTITVAFWVGAIVVLSAGVFVTVSDSQSPPIKIGTHTPLSGHNAYYGEHIVIGARLALERGQ